MAMVAAPFVRGFIAFLTFTCALGTGGDALVRTYEAGAVPHRSMQSFRDSIGVATHLSYNDGRYADATSTLQALRYLGVRHIRDGIVTGSQSNELNAFASIRYLMAAGMRFTLILGSSQDISAAVVRIGNLAHDYPGSIDAVEGPNEVDNSPVPGTGSPGVNALTFQRNLYQAVHRNHYLAGVPVLYFTGGARQSLSRVSGLADLQNTHPYAQAGQMPWSWIQKADKSSYDDPRGFPKATTEFGYSTTISGNYNGVDLQTQAELVLTELFDLFVSGHSPNAIYQLREAYPDASRNADTGFGLFLHDDSPKPAAQTIHNLLHNFPDEAASMTAMPVVQVDAMGTAVHSVILDLPHGAMSVWVWSEPLIWDPNNGRRFTAQPRPERAIVHIRTKDHWTARTFDPVSNSSQMLEPLTDSGQPLYQFVIGTHPTALVLTPSH